MTSAAVPLPLWRTTGLRSEEWRIICPCQEHGGARASHGFLRAPAASSLAFVRTHLGKFLLGSTLAIGGAGIPTAAMNTTLLAVPPPAVGIAAASEAPSPFRLITEKTRKEFFDPNFLDPLTEELVQEKFFRDEVPYGSLIYSEAKKYSLQPELLAAIVKAESDFRPGITSPRNALGLMQIVPSTGELMGATDLLDPADNVRTGAKYLRYLHDRFDGDQSMTLAAYNAGEGAVRRFGGVPPYKETRAYLRKVTDAKQEYHRRVAFRLMQHRTEVDAMPQAH
jgi:hypothetical protein